MRANSLAVCLLPRSCNPPAGPRQGFGPVGAEQVSGLDMASTQAPAVEGASDTTTTKTATTNTTTTGSGRSAGVAAAPAGADTEELQGRVQRSLKETQEAIKARVQVRLFPALECMLDACLVHAAGQQLALSHREYLCSKNERQLCIAL